MRFIQHQHLETILRDGIEMETRRMIGGDDGAGLLGISLNQVSSDRNRRGDIEFREQFLLPLRTKQLGADNEDF